MNSYRSSVHVNIVTLFYQIVEKNKCSYLVEDNQPFQLEINQKGREIAILESVRMVSWFSNEPKEKTSNKEEKVKQQDIIL